MGQVAMVKSPRYDFEFSAWKSSKELRHGYEQWIIGEDWWLNQLMFRNSGGSQNRNQQFVDKLDFSVLQPIWQFLETRSKRVKMRHFVWWQVAGSSNFEPKWIFVTACASWFRLKSIRLLYSIWKSCCPVFFENSSFYDGELLGFNFSDWRYIIYFQRNHPDINRTFMFSNTWLQLFKE